MPYQRHNTTKILKFIQTYIAQHHRPPAIRDIATEFGASTSVVTHHLTKLQQTGHITRHPRKSRSIKVIET